MTHRIGLYTLLALSLSAAPLAAQERARDTAAPGIARVELSALSGGRIVRTSDGAQLASIGFFRSDLSALTAGSDSAAHYARQFQRNWTVGRSLVAAGTVVALGALASYASNPTRNGSLGMSGGQAAAFAGGLGVALVGGLRMDTAHRALRQAVKWMDRDAAARVAERR